MTKKIYNQPEVTVAQIALDSMILAGSGAAENTLGIKTTDVDNMW